METGYIKQCEKDVYHTRLVPYQVVGMSYHHSNDTEAFLCIFQDENVSGNRVCPASAIFEFLTVLKCDLTNAH